MPAPRLPEHHPNSPGTQPQEAHHKEEEGRPPGHHGREAPRRQSLHREPRFTTHVLQVVAEPRVGGTEPPRPFVGPHGRPHAIEPGVGVAQIVVERPARVSGVEHRAIRLHRLLVPALGVRLVRGLKAMTEAIGLCRGGGDEQPKAADEE